MSQQTNLNASPYFDDFDPSNDYHRVLFKPGFPIQARELTTLQSILQNQVENIGNHFFKEGAKVLSGNTSFSPVYYCLILNNNFNNIPVSAYAEQLVGTRITGKTSGVSAYVDKILSSQESEIGNLTLYIRYLNSNITNNTDDLFIDGESLVCDTQINSGLLGNTFIAAGNTIATTRDQDCNGVGSSFGIDDGVYFIRGNFVNVNKETLILDQYSRTPSYRIGLYINEEIINSDTDESLNDNSQGFNNYSSPGADRLKISTSLFKKSLDDLNDNNFIELAKVVNGVLTSRINNTNSDLEDLLARRTYAESGDYYVKPFDVSILESLNNNRGNGGLFEENQRTYAGGTPSDNLGIYKISPGRAFVRGYDVETVNATYLDFVKPRATETIQDQSIVYNTGKNILLNNVFGSPTIGIGNTYYVSLRDSRRDTFTNKAPGNEIGLARVYDFNLESGSYELTNSNINRWGISLYDIQPYTEITLNQAHTLTVPTFVEGANSGAKGFLRSDVTVGTALTVYDVEGEFSRLEPLIFNGISDGRVSVAVKAYSVSDVKSIYATDNGIVGTGTFMADLIQTPRVTIGIASITSYTGGSNGICTVTSSNTKLVDIAKENNIVSFTNFQNTDSITYAKVNSVESDYITITPVTSVTGVASGVLPATNLNVSDFKILFSNYNRTLDDSLYTILPKSTISNVDLTSAELVIRKTFPVTISSNQIQTAVVADENESFLPFDEERYTLILDDGSIEVLTEDRFEFGVGQKTCQIFNLSGSGSATLVATLKKIKPKEKQKIKKRVGSITINKSKYAGSGIGTTTLNDGLSYGNFAYGTRVQDKTISLNVPDVIRVKGIFESSGTFEASAPTVVLSNISSSSGTLQDTIPGELIKGETSGSVAMLAEILSDTQISFIYENEIILKEGETVTFTESGVTATVLTLNFNSFNISQNYQLSDGQKNTFYDYSKIIRKDKSDEPTSQLKVYYQSGFYDSTDDGDITTVNSYSSFNYGEDGTLLGKVSTNDIIDIRPRVSEYTTIENSRSPLEFLGRSFDSSGNSASNILASDESINISFSYYLPRIDSIYINKDGFMQVKYGQPSENPQKPTSVDDAIEIATITLPPYLSNVKGASIKFLDYKRFRMSDIKKLEDRIKNLEYYTSLSLLESDTSNLFVPDSNGLNRFKSGFFVDNFSNFSTQDISVGVKNSVDIRLKELRPSHYTDSIDLTFFGPANLGTKEGGVLARRPINPFTDDLPFIEIVDSINVRRKNDIVTLDYSEVEWLNQPFATRTESVTPFLLAFWEGTLELNPASDTWVDTARLDARIIQREGNYAETIQRLAESGEIDPQTGFGPIVWGSWTVNWTGNTTTVERTEAETRESDWFYNQWWWTNYWGGAGYNTYTTTRIYEDTVETGIKERTGERISVTEEFDTTSLGDRVVSRDIIPIMRSRNIEFISKKLKPFTKISAFFDGINVTKYCIPKLLEVSMESGTFQVGETVVGKVIRTGISDRNAITVEASIRFRVAQQNHREGPFNSPSRTFRENPYTNTELPSRYSSVSTILNVDTSSLSRIDEGNYSGYVETGMTLTGKTSKAIATITDIKLIPDLSSTLIGSFFIPNPNIGVHPKFQTGEKVFTLTSSETNESSAVTFANEEFTSSGTLENIQEEIVSVRNARINTEIVTEVGEEVERVTGSQLTSTSTTYNCTNRQWWWQYWRDPLAQTFFIKEETGLFLTRCDLYFTAKDDMDIPVVVQLRTVQNGTPTTTVLPLSEVTIDPDQISISDDGSIATAIEFKAPVYLEAATQYALVVLSSSTKYRVAISRVGENDLITDEFISNQELLGSLFKSQNGSTWEPSQWEDLKFVLYRADFVSEGSIDLYNSTLSRGNNQIPTLLPNSLKFNSRKIRVALSSNIIDVGYVDGNTFSQPSTNSTGNLVGTAGAATGTLDVTNPGIGYTPSLGSNTYSNTNLVTITGNGRGATANVTISSGVAVAATISDGGSGYQVGDVVGVSSLGSSSTGTNARFTIANTGSTNELILDNVQGEFLSGVGNTLFYTNSSGITTELNYGAGGGINPSNFVVDSDGLHITVNHRNHGMYFEDNYVEISGVSPDTVPTKISGILGSTSTRAFSVEDASNLSTFEGVGVGTTNPGYLLIGDEVIQYTSVTGSTIGGNIVRGDDPLDYRPGTPVYKYELNGVNLARINKTHYLGDATVDNPITFDSYNIKLDMTNLSDDADDRSDNIGYPKLFLNKTKSAGGNNIKATQNMPFEVITPNIQNLTVTGTNITAELRTTTSQSLSGNEVPYFDNGFEQITLNEINYLNSPRLIASAINEKNKLQGIANGKSLNLRLLMGTSDSRISPVVDGQRMSVITTSNRANSIIDDYAADSRINEIQTDPSACQYITKEIALENPASSLKILVDAHLNLNSDLRAFYAISNSSRFNPIFVPFPGYNNIDDRGNIISRENNNGEPDEFITKSNTYDFVSLAGSFNEYTFTADQLPNFKNFRIKFVLTSTSQVYVPRLKNLRVIALA